MPLKNYVPEAQFYLRALIAAGSKFLRSLFRERLHPWRPVRLLPDRMITAPSNVLEIVKVGSC